MSYSMKKAEPRDGLKTQKHMLCPGESQIWKLTEDNNTDSFSTFTVGDLLTDLFVKTKERDALIKLSSFPKGNKEQFMFILPNKFLVQIQQHKKNGETYIKEDGNNNDYMWPFRPSGDNKKVFTLIHELFSVNGGKNFISEMQNHIISLLFSAEFSDRLELKTYLKEVGNKTIVPEETSKHANKAFTDLIETGSHYSFSLIIANFIISSLLGLTPLKYRYQDKVFYKAYLLNSLGMEYIWCPELITTPHEELHYIFQQYEIGYYEIAYNSGIQWLEKYQAESADEDLMLAYQILGFCLYKLSSSNDDEFRDRQEEGIALLEKCVATGVADYAVNHFLYDYFKKDDNKKAAEYLTTAFAQDYAKAVVEAASMFLKGEKVFDGITEDILLKKINSIIKNERKNSSVDVGECFYLRGRFSKNHGNDSDASKDFEAAAKRGNEKARQEISRKKRMERQSFPTFLNDSRSPCCFANTLTGNNLAVISSFPSNEWSLYTADETIYSDVNVVCNIDAFIKAQHIGDFEFCRPRIVFLFMSENEDKNLNECLILLDKLFNIVLEVSESRKWKIIDAVDIYVSAGYDTASMLIDANISDMGKDVYFKVHIADKSRDAVHRLLCDAPLFLPALSGIKKEKYTNVILFGDSEMNYCFIKESIACAYLGKTHPITITLLGKDADKLERRFRQECPGIYNDNPRISCIRPDFIQCDIEETDFPGYIYGSEHDNKPDNEIVRALNNGNYFVVDFADDLENIRFASELRTWLLRSRGTFDRAPFIAVKCSNERNSYLAGHLTLSGQASGNSYFNKYDLFPIGVSRQIYSYRNMIESPVLNDFALCIHKSYYGDAERAAENDFYSYSYNADSSLLTAIGLSYRFFAAGVEFGDKELYLNYGFFVNPEAVSEFEKIIADYNKYKIDFLASLEQSRWNGFMLSRAWESAGISQVQAYKEQSTGWNHKHILAKLHPFIREWDDLDDSDLLKILDILKSKFDYDRNPQEITRKSIVDTATFFKVSVKEERKTY